MTTPVVYNLGERNALPLAPSMTIRHSRESGNPLRQTLLQRQAIYPDHTVGKELSGGGRVVCGHIREEEVAYGR